MATTESTIQNLCDNCFYEIAECEAKNVKFGNGLGDDNVIECDTYCSDTEVSE